MMNFLRSCWNGFKSVVAWIGETVTSVFIHTCAVGTALVGAVVVQGCGLAVWAISIPLITGVTVYETVTGIRLFESSAHTRWGSVCRWANKAWNLTYEVGRVGYDVFRAGRPELVWFFSGRQVAQTETVCAGCGQMHCDCNRLPYCSGSDAEAITVSFKACHDSLDRMDAVSAAVDAAEAEFLQRADAALTTPAEVKPETTAALVQAFVATSPIPTMTESESQAVLAGVNEQLAAAGKPPFTPEQWTAGMAAGKEILGAAFAKGATEESVETVTVAAVAKTYVVLKTSLTDFDAETKQLAVQTAGLPKAERKKLYRMREQLRKTIKEANHVAAVAV